MEKDLLTLLTEDQDNEYKYRFAMKNQFKKLDCSDVMKEKNKYIEEYVLLIEYQEEIQIFHSRTAYELVMFVLEGLYKKYIVMSQNLDDECKSILLEDIVKREKIKDDNLMLSICKVLDCARKAINIGGEEINIFIDQYNSNVCDLQKNGGKVAIVTLIWKK